MLRHVSKSIWYIKVPEIPTLYRGLKSILGTLHVLYRYLQMDLVT